MPTQRRTRPSRGRGTYALQARLAAAERVVQAHRRVNAALHTIVALALREQPLAMLLQAVVQEVSAATGFPVVVIELYDEARQLMEVAAVTGSALLADQACSSAPVAQNSLGPGGPQRPDHG